MGSNFRVRPSWFGLRAGRCNLRGESARVAEANLLTCRAWTILELDTGWLAHGLAALSISTAAEPWQYSAQEKQRESYFFFLPKKNKNKKANLTDPLPRCCRTRQVVVRILCRCSEPGSPFLPINSWPFSKTYGREFMECSSPVNRWGLFAVSVAASGKERELFPHGRSC